MKTRLIPLFVLLFVCIFTIALCAMSFRKAFSQVDTTAPVKPMVKIDSTVQLEKKVVEAKKAYELSKDTVSSNLEDLGKLKPQAAQVRSTLKQATDNLKQAAATNAVTEKDVQRIERVYRFDTSARPVIINVHFHPTEYKPRSWFKRRN